MRTLPGNYALLQRYCYYLAGSGFPTEQEQPEQRASGRLTFPEVFGETDEIELVKAVATQAELIIECLGYLQEQVEAQARTRVLHEVEHLSHDFLVLASHELRTPLTGILGNLQLAQRRLEILRRQIAAQSEHVSKHIAQAQQPLASASQSARLQQRMIDDIIDDMRIQSNQLEIHVQRCDLLAVLTTAIARQQRLVPERGIVLGTLPEEQRVPIMADAARITQVFTLYLANALTSSPAEEPVTVQVMVKDLVARVSVHDEGPGIPLEEQQHVWERGYRAKGSTVQHELDLSLGLGLYLCRALIERLGGLVGLQSAPGQGTTFWFTLPVIPSTGE